MADNVTITPGSGATVSTEEVSQLNGGSVTPQHVQRMLLAIRTADGTAVDIGATSGALNVAVQNFPATQAISASLGAPAGVRLSDGAAAIGSTAQRLWVDDGGGSLTVDGTVTPSSAGDVASALVDNRKTVTTPATAVVLASSTPCKWVQVTALTSNTGQVNVGGSGVLATSGGSTGTPLVAGQSTTLPVDNVNKVFVDARVAGEGVSFTVGS